MRQEEGDQKSHRTHSILYLSGVLVQCKVNNGSMDRMSHFFFFSVLKNELVMNRKIKSQEVNFLSIGDFIIRKQ